jgi:hypothetical protein
MKVEQEMGIAPIEAFRDSCDLGRLKDPDSWFPQASTYAVGAGNRVGDRYY